MTIVAAMSFLRVRLDAKAELLSSLAAFYSGTLELPLTRSDPGVVAVEVGETTLEFRAGAGDPFYHSAFLVPGDRFAAARRWAADRIALLPDEDTGERVFDFEHWDAHALYFQDPAGSIGELIAQRGVGESGTTGPFHPSELLGFSEVGIVGDPPSLAEALSRAFALEVWSGTVTEEKRLAFVGEKARTLILARAGRPWLPTWRPAEAHPVEVVIAGRGEGEVRIETGGCVRGSARQKRV